MSPFLKLDTLMKQTLSDWHKARLKSTGQTFDKLVVGAAIFQLPNDAEPRILVVKRAATEDYFPKYFEMPGGKIDPGESIGEGLARELFEETGLKMSKVLAILPEFTYTTEKSVLESGKETIFQKTSCQLNFVVEVESGPVKLNDEEHSEWLWATDIEAVHMHMTELMQRCVSNALAWAKERGQ